MKPDEPIAQKNIITRGLPKTGQITSYFAGDDGIYEAGWWVGRLNANNKTRFRIMTLVGRDVVFDRATGLMWARDGLEPGCRVGMRQIWNIALDYCNTLNFAGFDDWRLPNMIELLSICDWSRFDPVHWTPFTNTQILNYYGYWTSTTYARQTTTAWYIRCNDGYAGTRAKIEECFLRAVRGGL